MAAPPDARKQLLTSELVEAELALDAKTRNPDPTIGPMRRQLAIACQRAKVLGLRAELVEIEKSRHSGERRHALRAEQRELLMGIKEAELSARAASKQASDDELPELLARLREASALEGELANLHH